MLLLLSVLLSKKIYMASQDNAHYFGMLIVPKQVIVNLLYFTAYFNFCSAINENKNKMLTDSKMCNLK